MLAASRTAGVVAVIDRYARRLGVPLPDEVVDAAAELRGWARSVKSQLSLVERDEAAR